MIGATRKADDLLADVTACHVVGYGMSLDYEHAQAAIDALAELSARRAEGRQRTINWQALAEAGLALAFAKALVTRDGAA